AKEDAADETILAVQIEHGGRRINSAADQAKDDLDVFDAKRLWGGQMVDSPGNYFRVRPDKGMGSGRGQPDTHNAGGGFPPLKNLELTLILGRGFLSRSTEIPRKCGENKRAEPFGSALWI